MKPHLALRLLQALCPPATWPEVFGTIITLNLLFLALAFLFNWLNRYLP